jgi:hypothetical protein
MPTCQQTAQAVLSMVADIQEMGDRPESAAASQQLSWRSPARGCLKINFDRAFMQQTNTGAWGFIVRDHEGQPVLLAEAGGMQAGAGSCRTFRYLSN